MRAGIRGDRDGRHSGQGAGGAVAGRAGPGRKGWGQASGGTAVVVNRGRLLVGLCWAWVALVAAYMVWGWINHAGLYGWLADLQLERSGSFRPDLTGLIPGFLLAA